MTNKEKYKCELLLFHSTTKENLKGIMKEGIKPGMKGGWCDLWTRAYGEEGKESVEMYRKECQTNIFLSSSFHKLEEEMPEGSETIIAVCLPKRMVNIKDIPFEKWEKTHDPFKEKFENVAQVAVKEIISPQYIVGCLDVENSEKRYPGSSVGDTKFRINKDCV